MKRNIDSFKFNDFTKETFPRFEKNIKESFNNVKEELDRIQKDLKEIQKKL